MLFGAVLFVSFVACANLAALFLARLSARRREVFIRAALGANRSRLVRLFATEGLLLALAGSALGIVLAHWMSVLARAYLPARDIPYWTSFTLDTNVLAFTLTLSAICGTIVGLTPAMILFGKNAGLSSRDLGTGVFSSRSEFAYRQGLVTLQVACSLVLLCGAGLLAKTFLDVVNRDLGASKKSLVRGFLYGQAKEYDTPERQLALAHSVLTSLQHLPDAAGASLSGRPLGSPQAGLTREGDDAMLPAGIAPSSAESITPDAFKVLGIPLLDGRAFTDADGPLDPLVAVLDKPTAGRLFPNERAVGRRVKFGPPSSSFPWMTIIGIVGASRRDIFKSQDPYSPVMYRPLDQAPTAMFAFAVRTRGPAQAILPTVRATLRTTVPSVPLAALTTIEERLNQQLAPLRVNSVVLGALSLFALSIAALGVFGTVAYFVTQRTTEIGIRLALGAPRKAVLWVSIRSSIVMIMMGVCVGLGGSFALTRILRAWLYGTSPTDPRVFAVASLVLAVTALAAGYIPARRVLRVDPMIALRNL
jgi:putative ABC transport system permease protein